jgi:hypothetical protein
MKGDYGEENLLKVDVCGLNFGLASIIIVQIFLG